MEEICDPLKCTSLKSALCKSSWALRLSFQSHKRKKKLTLPLHILLSIQTRTRSVFLCTISKKMALSLWAQDDLFDKDALNAILSTSLNTDARRGKAEFTLLELLQVAKAVPYGNASRFLNDVVPRERETRWDITLSTLWVNKMARINVAFAYAIDIADGVRRNMGRCPKANIVWHAQIVHPGSSDQPLHVDDKPKRRRKGCYFTLIIPLTQDPRSGGTHFPLLNRTFSSFGGALAFDGSVEHAGLGNRSKKDRIFLYAAIFTGEDRN